MQLQLSINDVKANIFLELLEIFKKDNIVNNYTIVDNFNDYEKEILSDLQNLHSSIQEDGHKTSKFIQIDNFK